jgi:cyd operon protein YbgT
MWYFAWVLGIGFAVLLAILNTLWGENEDARVLPLLLAIAVMLGTTAWPGALAGPSGAADHPAAMALFWAMSAGFVAGVGFRPRKLLIRLLFSPLACWLGVILAGLRMGSLMA